MLIELRDGDTIFVYNPSPGDSENTEILCGHLKRMAPDESKVRVVVVDGYPFKIEVYRPPVAPAPVEEPDGWHPWDSAPRDGQLIDAWVMHSENGNRRIPGVSFIDYEFFVHSSKDYSFRKLSEFGNPSHWRYPPKGPKA